jgi:hypothetical protein
MSAQPWSGGYRARTELVDEHRPGHRACEVPHRKAGVQGCLRAGVRDPDAVEDEVRVVRDQPVARPLGEDGDGNDDPEPTLSPLLRDLPQREHSPHALAIAGCSPQDRVRLPFGELSLRTDSMPDLRQLEDDQSTGRQLTRHKGAS